MCSCVEDNGGKAVFGDFSCWGNPLSIRKIFALQNLPPSSEDELIEITETQRQRVEDLQETVNLESLLEYAAKDGQENNYALQQYVSTVQEKFPDQLTVSYYKKSFHDGTIYERKFASGISM